MHAWSRSYLSAFTLLLMGLLLPQPCLRAEDDDQELQARARARRQAASTSHEQQAAKARELIDRLDLSRAQARKLVPIAEQAALLHIERYERQAQLLPEILEAFADFAREDSFNQGFTPEVERRTARVNHRAHQAQKRTTERLVALEEQAGQVLTTPQRELLNDRPRKQRPGSTRPPRTDARSRARAVARQREQARRQPLREAREELHSLYQQRHPQTGPLGRYLLHPYGVEPLCEAARMRTPAIVTNAVDVLANGTSEYPCELIEQQQAEVQELRTEINNWNLINGLHVSADQIEGITAVYERALTPGWEIVQRDRRSGVPYRDLFALEREVEQELNSGQREVLAKYKACLIPPQNLKDPVRIGQASDHSHYERWLERARGLSRKELARQIDQTLEREAEQHGKLDRAERKQRVALLRKTVRRASDMSGAEFELSKAEFAAQAAPPDRIQNAKNRVATASRQLGETGAITQFMLTAQFMDQLRLRGQQLAAGVTTKQVDLAKGPQAENCDESCAIDGKGRKGKQD